VPDLKKKTKSKKKMEKLQKIQKQMGYISCECYIPKDFLNGRQNNYGPNRVVSNTCPGKKAEDNIVCIRKELFPH
jgi:hypothetical protein